MLLNLAVLGYGTLGVCRHVLGVYRSMGILNCFFSLITFFLRVTKQAFCNENSSWKVFQRLKQVYLVRVSQAAQLAHLWDSEFFL